MALEDHAGDVVRKAREMAGIAPEAAARAAGVTRAELSVFESEGTAPEKIAWEPLAKLVGLNAAKLQRVAQGWEPVQPNLLSWQYLRRLTTREGGMDVQCYLAWDADTHEAALFDTGFDAGVIFATLRDQRLELRHVFITHSHYDHVSALGALERKFPQLQVHRNSGKPMKEVIAVGRLRVNPRPTPGHANDGATYVISGWPEGAPAVAVVGDALFAGSLGGAPGRGELARGKVREQIFSLPPATLLCPGHGPFTTVAQELENNPFV